MDPQVQQELLKRLDALAAKLGVAANELWVIYMRQARLEAIENLIWALLFGLVVFLVIKNYKRLLKFSEDRELPWPVVGATLIAIPCCIYFIDCVNTAIDRIFNPGMFAFTGILTALR